jgi:hypothetical protein
MEIGMESRDASLSLVKTNLFTQLISHHHQPRTYMTSLVSSKESRQESFSLLQIYIQVGQDSRFKKK